jgi:tungstate transport system substrate-binding protein
MKLVEFVTGPEGQSLIAGYKLDGEPLFFVYREGEKH